MNTANYVGNKDMKSSGSIPDISKYNLTIAPEGGA